MISTDGVGMHRKSSKTFWPIAGVLANLPAEVRCLHRLIHCWALLPGDNTKNLQLYMTPLVEELVRLQRGVHLSDEMETPIRAELLFTTGDYPAHCKLTLKNQKSLIGKTLSRYKFDATDDVCVQPGACNRCKIEGTSHLRRVVYGSTDQEEEPDLYVKLDAFGPNM